MDYSPFDMQHALERKAAFVDANKANKCRRCSTFGVALDKRGNCEPCAAKRVASMKVDERTPEQVQRNEDAQAMNARLKRAHAAREALTPALTIASLLSGPSGQPQVTGGDLVRCTQAVTLRAAFADAMRRLGAAEAQLIAFPYSEAANSVYDRLYERIEKTGAAIRENEALIMKSYPDLVCAPVRYPARLERTEPREWLEV